MRWRSCTPHPVTYIHVLLYNRLTKDTRHTASAVFSLMPAARRNSTRVEGGKVAECMPCHATLLILDCHRLSVHHRLMDGLIANRSVGIYNIKARKIRLFNRQSRTSRNNRLSIST